MNKLRILCAAALICLLPGAAWAADNTAAADVPPLAAEDIELNTAQPLSAFGEVQEKGDDYLLLKLEANGMDLTQLRLNISEDSLLLDNATGQAVQFADIKVGQRVFAYYGRAMTRSLPPQSHLELLLTNVDDATPANFWEVEAFEADVDGNVWVTVDNGGLIISITKDVWAGGEVPALKDGDKLLAWYDIVLTSYPGQTGANKAMLLPQAEEPAAPLASTQLAEVLEVNTDTDHGNLLVKVDGQEVQLNIPAGFAAVSAKDGSPVNWRTIKPGDQVLANYGPQMTFSLPPQSPLNYLVVDLGDNPPAGLYTVEELNSAAGTLVATVDGGSLLLGIGPDLRVGSAASIRQGDKLLVWYDMLAETYPAQATATRVIPVTAQVKQDAPLPTYLTAGDIHLANVIERANGHMYVPLRAVAEALGFEVAWSDAERSARLTNGEVQTTVYINKDSYYTATAAPGMVGMSAPHELGAAPYLQNRPNEQKTFVPAELFELLGFAVEESDDTLHITAR